MQERDIINKIADKFSEMPLDSIEIIFDMMLPPGTYDANRITALRFKDYLMEVNADVRE